jgi:hypothetical protein
MIQKFNVGICTFSYGGNGGISSEVPDIREWMTPLVSKMSRDERIAEIRIWNLADTPITMTRNRAVLMAREYGMDILVMVDSDMKPDLGGEGSKPFFDSSFDFFVQHYHKGPCVIGAPYCGPPPKECVYVFRWQNAQSENANPDFQLEMYDRHTAVKMAGIQPCAALPTGLILFDMRAFALTEPKGKGSNPWFYYEFTDKYAADKASTEDVTATRDMSLVGEKQLGYNPIYCNWDAWAGHWKPKCVGKPVVVEAKDVSKKLLDDGKAGFDSSVKIVDFRGPDLPVTFDSMGMDLPDEDARAIHEMVSAFTKEHGRPPYVCEVGAWAGRSAIIMAKAGARVLCVDTWEGSSDQGAKAYDGSRGTPLEVFKKNVRPYGIGHAILRSPEAAKQFTDSQFDIVYIDAEHTYEAVKADIEAWKPKAKFVLAGHDYHSFPDVARAVKDCGLVPSVTGNVWRVGI